MVNVTTPPKNDENTPSETHKIEDLDAPKRIVHRALIRNGTFRVSRGRVEDLNRRRNGHKVAEQRERQRRIRRLTAHEHMVPPDEKAKDGDGYARTGDESISEYKFASEGGDQFTYNAHRGQDHDVNDGVRIKPA